MRLQPLTQIYPDKLPRDHDMDGEVCLLVTDDEILSHPRIALERPELPIRRLNTMTPVWDIMSELKRLYRPNTARWIGMVVPWVIKGGKRIQEVRWRNPTVWDVVRATLKNRPQVHNVLAAFRMLTDAQWDAYLQGKKTMQQLKREIGQFPITRFPKSIYADMGRDAYGRRRDVLGPLVCRECGRKPRSRRSADGHAFFCAKERGRVTCPNANTTKQYYLSRDAAVADWNERQG